MTDKDPKDMTASELLLKADSHPCSMCRLVMNGDESCATRGCASWAYRLADKIDAELAHARAGGISEGIEASMRQGAVIWAKANGWPDFKPGEDFRAWLDRCALPRPRFEDGEPVQFGELVSSNLFGAVKVSAIEFTEDGTHVKDEPDGDWSTSLEVTTSRLKRPAPEVLGADGEPIVVGETVWHIVAGWKGTVTAIKPWGVEIDYAGDDRPEPLIWAYESLTHTPPDTQEKIDEDALKIGIEYWGCVGVRCSNCPARIDGATPAERYCTPLGGCNAAMNLDLLRRQRELDKRTEGE